MSTSWVSGNCSRLRSVLIAIFEVVLKLDVSTLGG